MSHKPRLTVPTSSNIFSLSQQKRQSYKYTYDERGRLTKVKKRRRTVEEYSYDKNGNRKSAKVYGKRITASYTLDDNLVVYGDNTYRYDEDGYLNEKTTPNGTTTYSYGTLGELLSVVTATKTITYKHNANNQRVAKLIDGQITEKYLWANLTTLLAIYNADDSLKQRFEYATQRMPISMSMGNDKYYLHYDQVGSLRAVSTSNHKIIKEIVYDSFGNILSETNEDFKVPFGFAGGLYDEDTKLTRFGYRDYDAYVGKWTAKDPIGFAGGDSNLYGYVGHDPVNGIDPSGLWTFGITFNLGFGGGIGGTMGLNFVIDGHGNFQTQLITGGGGYAGFGAGGTLDFEFSNADCVDMLQGNGYQYGPDGKLIIDLEVGIFGGKGYTGIYLGGGIGLNVPIPIPIGFGMFATHTTSLFGN